MENQSLLSKIAAEEEKYIKSGQRRGQAFFNALHDHAPSFADKICGTEDDPFYVNDKKAAQLRRKIVHMIWAEADSKREVK